MASNKQNRFQRRQEEPKPPTPSTIPDESVPLDVPPLQSGENIIRLADGVGYPEDGLYQVAIKEGKVAGIEPIETANELPANDERALVPLAIGLDLPEAGTYAVTINDDGELTSIAPKTEDVRRIGQADIIVLCPRKGRKCIAEFECKRRETGQVEMVCKECVGPARENEYQKML